MISSADAGHCDTTNQASNVKDRWDSFAALGGNMLPSASRCRPLSLRSIQQTNQARVRTDQLVALRGTRQRSRAGGYVAHDTNCDSDRKAYR